MSWLRRLIGRLVRWSLAEAQQAFAARGPNVFIGQPMQVNYPQRVFIGRDVYMGGHALLHSAGGIRIGDGCIFGPFVHIYSSNHRYEGGDTLPFDEVEYFKPVDIGPNVWIAGDVVILPGVTVGEGAVIAAGSVVVKDVPAGAVVGGVPAKALKMRDMERYHSLKAEGRILNAMVGSGCNKPRPIGGVPAAWYRQAGLPVPAEAVGDVRDIAPSEKDRESR